MCKKRNEVSYYPEIQQFIGEQLKSNFLSMNKHELFVFWGIGELKTNLRRIIDENPEICKCTESFAKRVAPLSLDIFALITDGVKFEILILEVKLVKSAGLSEWSQLIGYCLVADAKYGLLINIDNGSSPRLSDLLRDDKSISDVQTLVEETIYDHKLGFMEWNSLTHNFEYSNLGCISSLSKLSNIISQDFANCSEPSLKKEL